jgi:hypothetical protein
MESDARAMSAEEQEFEPDRMTVSYTCDTTPMKFAWFSLLENNFLSRWCLASLLRG